MMLAHVAQRVEQAWKRLCQTVQSQQPGFPCQIHAQEGPRFARLLFMLPRALLNQGIRIRVGGAIFCARCVYVVKGGYVVGGANSGDGEWVGMCATCLEQFELAVFVEGKVQNGINASILSSGF